MNPYEEPNSNLERPAEARARIQWFAIALAIVIYFITELVVRSGLFNPDIDLDRPQKFSWYMLANLIFFLALIFAPWLASAIFLALRVKARRLLHALIFSVTLTLVYLIGSIVVSIFRSELWFGDQLLQQAWSLFLVSLLTTLIVMAISRAIRNIFGRDRSSPS